MTKRLRPDVVLTDIGMPCLDGVKATYPAHLPGSAFGACGHPYDVL
ncbi:MAG: hypothetical protein R6X27_01630 [Candidatus Desulfacyla sp.]